MKTYKGLPSDFVPIEAFGELRSINIRGEVYLPKDYLLSLLSVRIKEIEQEKSTINEGTMSGQNKMNRLRGIQKELKQIIESFK